MKATRDRSGVAQAFWTSLDATNPADTSGRDNYLIFALLYFDFALISSIRTVFPPFWNKNIYFAIKGR